MKPNAKYLRRFLPLLALLAITSFLGTAAAGQVPQQPSSALETQDGGDPIRQLNLTPEQREQIRAIRENNRAERAVIKEHLDSANHALEEILNSEAPDEAFVEQRLRDVAAAQSAAMRMRVLTEVRVRRVLSPEQRKLLRSLQEEARESRRERLLDNAAQRQQQRQARPRDANPRNGLGPLAPPRNNPRRLPL